MSEKPILFNTEMVRAILDGRKTQTRRIVKNQLLSEEQLKKCGKPCYPGDILYVRETWKQATTGTAGPGLIDLYLYKADEPQDTTGMMVEGSWHPSIHMPKEAARIWLKVTGIACQRIQNITVADARAEGIVVDEYCNETGEIYHTDNYGNTWEAEVSEEADTLFAFGALWDSTVRKEDLEQYGWNANPWVWVIEFERVEGKHDN